MYFPSSLVVSPMAEMGYGFWNSQEEEWAFNLGIKNQRMSHNTLESPQAGGSILQMTGHAPPPPIPFPKSLT